MPPKKKSYEELHSLTETELPNHLTKTVLLSSLIQAAGEMEEWGEVVCVWGGGVVCVTLCYSDYSFISPNEILQHS